MAQRRVYLDHNATTPLSERVRNALTVGFDISGNASSMHACGREALAAVEAARESVAALINASPAEIFFTASGSESNNTVLKTLLSPPEGSPLAKGRQGLVTSAIEHACVLQTAAVLETAGVSVHRLGVDVQGQVDPAGLSTLLDGTIGLVSVMLANNEIGTVQDVQTLAATAHQAGALFHTDAVQAVGKIPVDVHALGVDYLTLSGHKFYGPKGVGALFVRKGAPLAPLIHGGQQEGGMRSGTYNTLGILGMGEAARETAELLESGMLRERVLRDMLLEGIRTAIPDIHVNGNPETGLPNTLNVSFAGAEGESILLYLDMEGIAVSTGSACATGSLEPSYVLMATGLGAELAHGSIRFTLGRGTSEEDIDYTVAVLIKTIDKIRSMSTVYKKEKMSDANWLYSEKVKEHFMNPKNVLSGDEPFEADGEGIVGNIQCGDQMQIKIQVEDGMIRDCRWKVYGCASAIASTSMLSEMVKGMTLEKAYTLKPEDIVVQLGGLPAIKYHCSVLGDEALREAIDDYCRKSGQEAKIAAMEAVVVCACKRVTDKEIEQAVKEGVRNWEELQLRTKIGTVCTFCHEQAGELLHEYVHLLGK